MIISSYKICNGHMETKIKDSLMMVYLMVSHHWKYYIMNRSETTILSLMFGVLGVPSSVSGIN